MGTTEYFNKDVKDAAGKETFGIEVGTTGFAGQGPQMYLKFNDSGLILNHKDAAEFFEAIALIANYLGYKPPDFTGQWVLRRD